MEEQQKFAQDEELAQDFSFWSLFKFTVPSIFTFVFIAVYQMVDGLFIERYVGDLAIRPSKKRMEKAQRDLSPLQ